MAAVNPGVNEGETVAQPQPVGFERAIRVAKPRKLRRGRRQEEVQERYRSLAGRLRMLQSAAVDSSWVLGVSACRRGEGVSTVSKHLALALSETVNGKCLLVDANPRRASLHRRKAPAA